MADLTALFFRYFFRRSYLIGSWLAPTLLLVSACRPKTSATKASAIHAETTFAPAPPRAGISQLTVRLTDASGKPIRLGQISVEGNMNHAGMRPSFAQLTEGASGVYFGSIEFTMGGDWTLLVTGDSASTGPISTRINVPGVRAQ